MHTHKSQPNETLQAIRFHPCPHCSTLATLLTDIDETRPKLDLDNHKQYHCLSCQHVFSVNAQNNVCNERPRGIPQNYRDQWISFTV